MSKGKKVLEGMPKLYQSTYMDVALFNYVQGIISVRPTFRLTAAIDLFIDHYKLDYSEYSTELGQMVYYRMLDKFRESFKLNKDDNVS